MSAADILLPALIACALLVFSHAYLGLHVLARGIIFLDLALAQTAALGAAMAFYFGADEHDVLTRVAAFALAVIAALAFTWLRRINNTTTREALIGIVYVVSTALSVLFLSNSVQGMEELKAMFNGAVLWVQWRDIALLAVVTGILAIIHWWFRKRFTGLSFSGNVPEHADIWEFLFYLSFAVIITLAVDIAGVLLVFAMLVIPALTASLLLQSFRQQLILAWFLGIVASVCGLVLAYNWDLPAGATLVSVMGLLPVIAGITRYAQR